MNATLRRTCAFALRMMAWAVMVSLLATGCAREQSDPGESTAESTEALATGTVLQMSPPSASIPVSVDQPFQATLIYPRARPRTRSNGVSWTVSDPSVAAVDSSGLVTALKAGSATVTAVYQGLTASAKLTVTSATLVTVVVTPPTRRIHVGTRARFRATGTFSDGTTFSLQGAVTWTSTAAAVATVDASGRVTGVAAGETAIVATDKATSQSAKGFLTVGSAPLKSVAIAPASASVIPGMTVPFLATGTFADNATQDLTDTVAWSSSSSTVATISNDLPTAGVATAASAGTTTVKAVVGRRSATATLTVTGLALTSIAVTPATASVPNGTTTQLVATGMYSDHTTQDITALVTWSSSLPSVAWVSNATGSNGLLTALAIGTSTITATDVTQIAGSAVLTVTPAVLAALSISPPTASVALGLPQQFAASGTFTDSTTRDVTNSVTWTSSAPGVAAVSNAQGSAGLASTLAVGMTTIAARDYATGVTASASMNVTSAILESLAITPPSATIANGLSAQFTATGKYSDGSTHDITALVTWSASTGTATVSNAEPTAGLASSGGVGASTIQAIVPVSGLTATAALTVTPATVVSIGVTPALPSIPLGTAQAFTATGMFTDGTTQDLTALVTWASSDADASVSNVAGSNGVATSMAVGATTITATYPSTGQSGATTLTVTPATLVSIAITPPSPTLPAGTTQQFAATGTYSDGTTTDLTWAATWASSSPTTLAVSNSAGTIGVGTALAGGGVILSATASGVAGTTSVTVTQATLVAIAVTPAAPTIALGTNQAFAATGTYSDGTTKDITSSVTWSSSSVGATISNAAGSIGVATSESIGSATIAATDSATMVSGSTTLTVAGTVLVSITVTPGTQAVPGSRTQQFVATGTYSDGTSQFVTSSVSWSSSGPSATISNAQGSVGLATAGVPGTATITALDPTTGVQATATFTATTAFLMSVVVTPQTPNIAVGLMLGLDAIGTFSDGSTLDITTSVTWTSNSTSIASVSNANGSVGTVTGGTAGLAAITATDPATNDSGVVFLSVLPTVMSLAQGNIGPLGGQMTSADGSLLLVVPEGSVSSYTPFSVQRLQTPPAGAVGPAYDIEPSGTTFGEPITLSFNYKGFDLGGVDPRTLSLASYDSSGWDPVASGTNLLSGTIGADVSHFSQWGFNPPAPSGFAPATVTFQITSGLNGIGTGDVVEALVSDGSSLAVLPLHNNGDPPWPGGNIFYTYTSPAFALNGLKAIQSIELMYIPDSDSPTGCSNLAGCKWDLDAIRVKGGDANGGSTYCLDNQNGARCNPGLTYVGGGGPACHFLKTLSVPWASKAVSLVSNLLGQGSLIAVKLLAQATAVQEAQALLTLTEAFDSATQSQNAGVDFFDSPSGDGCPTLKSISVSPATACLPDDPNVQLQLEAAAIYAGKSNISASENASSFVSWSIAGQGAAVSTSGLVTTAPSAGSTSATVTATAGALSGASSLTVTCPLSASECCFNPSQQQAPTCQSTCASPSLAACTTTGPAAASCQSGGPCASYALSVDSGALTGLSVCGPPCSVGSILCEDACASLNSDSNNCGACGNVCSGGTTCISGICCLPGQAACGGVCTSTQSDDNNCGNCGVICGSGLSCVSGSCCSTCASSCYATASGPSSAQTATVTCGSGDALLCPPSGCPNQERCIVAENNCNCTLRYDNAASAMAVCDPSTACAQVGAACGGGGCCSGGQCNNSASPRVCVASASCGVSWTPTEAGGPCATSADCCDAVCPTGGGQCGGPSNNCNSAGGSCARGSDCCANQCNIGTTASTGPVCTSSGCKNLGGSCSTDADCCSSTCGNGTCGGNCNVIANVGSVVSWTSGTSVGTPSGGSIVPGTYTLATVWDAAPPSYTASSQITFSITSNSISEVETGVTFNLGYTTSGSSITTSVTCQGEKFGAPFFGNYGISSYSTKSNSPTSNYIDFFGIIPGYRSSVEFEFVQVP